MAKKAKLDPRTFQPSWRDDYGFIPQKDRAVCVLCLDAVVMRTSSVKRHFETTHEKSFKDEADKKESIKRALSAYDKQTNLLKTFTTAKQHATEASYEIVHCIAKRGKPFTNYSPQITELSKGKQGQGSH